VRGTEKLKGGQDYIQPLKSIPEKVERYLFSLENRRGDKGVVSGP
jgi:hypothetical protein